MLELKQATLTEFGMFLYLLVTPFYFIFLFCFFIKKISASDCSYIVLIFRAILASVFLLSSFLIKKKKKSVYDAQFCPTASWKIRNIFARVTMSQFSNYGGCKLKVPW